MDEVKLATDNEQSGQPDPAVAKRQALAPGSGGQIPPSHPDPEQALPPEAEIEQLRDADAELMDYLSEETWSYGLTELSQVHSLAYFLPLLRELFNVNDARAKVVFTMLFTLMVDRRVRWTRGELDEKFHWIKDGQRNYLLQRLSNVGWLEYFRDQGVYMITDKGEALMRILSRFTLGEELVDNEGAALAEIEFSMLLDLDDLSDRLKFLRNRLLKHNIRASNALDSESPYRVLEVYQQLQSAYRWAAQTREALDEIDTAAGDPEQWEAIRSVHNHLSNLHSQISEMQLVLQGIQRREINIASLGVTHLDFDNYLINSTPELLAKMMLGHLKKVPHPFFLIEDFAFPEAEDILRREIVEEEEDLHGWDTEVTELDPELNAGTPLETEAFAQALTSLTESAKSPRKWRDIAKLITGQKWEVAAYRFSLLTMLADLQALGHLLDETADPLVGLPIEAKFNSQGKLAEFDQENGEHWIMTRGRVRKREKKEAQVETDE